MGREAREDLLERAITAIAAATSTSPIADPDLFKMRDVIHELRTGTDFMRRAEALASATISRSAVGSTSDSSSVLAQKAYVTGLTMGIAATVVAIERGSVG